MSRRKKPPSGGEQLVRAFHAWLRGEIEQFEAVLQDLKPGGRLGESLGEHRSQSHADIEGVLMLLNDLCKYGRPLTAPAFLRGEE